MNRLILISRSRLSKCLPWEMYRADLSIDLNKHHVPKTLLDKFAYRTVKSLRIPTDVFFQERVFLDSNQLARPICTEVVSLEDSLDWRRKVVQPPRVLNQRNLDSCAAAALITVTEYMYLIYRGTYYELSLQHAADLPDVCNFHDEICGNFRRYCFSVANDGGLFLDRDYPYTGKFPEGDSVQAWIAMLKAEGKPQVPIGFPRWFHSPSDELLIAYLKRHPVAVMISAEILGTKNWDIIRKPSYKVNFDHMAVLIGLGYEKYPWGKLPYWVVQNCWGQNVGTYDGFHRIERGVGLLNDGFGFPSIW